MTILTPTIPPTPDLTLITFSTPTPESVATVFALMFSFAYDPVWWFLLWNTGPVQGTLARLVSLVQAMVPVPGVGGTGLGLTGLVSLWWYNRRRGVL